MAQRKDKGSKEATQIRPELHLARKELFLSLKPEPYHMVKACKKFWIDTLSGG